MWMSSSVYTDYLESSKKHNYSLTSPVRELSENLTFQFLPISESTSASSVSLLSGLLSVLEWSTPFFSVRSCWGCCSNKTKHNFISTLVFLSYSHASIYSWQQHWKSSLCLVSSVNDSSYTDRQKVIQNVKHQIPVYHTRTFRKATFSVFGRLSSSKPAAARYLYRLFTGRYIEQIAVTLWTEWDGEVIVYTDRATTCSGEKQH